MKKLIFIASVALLQFGCATVPQSNAIQSAVEWEVLMLLTKKDGHWAVLPKKK